MNADWGAGKAERAGGVKDVAGAKDASPLPSCVVKDVAGARDAVGW